MNTTIKTKLRWGMLMCILHITFAPVIYRATSNITGYVDFRNTFSKWSAFHHSDKIPDIINLLKKSFILVHDFRSFSPRSIATITSGRRWGKTSWWENLAEEAVYLLVARKWTRETGRGRETGKGQAPNRHAPWPNFPPLVPTSKRFYLLPVVPGLQCRDLQGNI